MIYFDTSATSIQKPPEVAKAVARSIEEHGNAGRSFYDASLDASRLVYDARTSISRLIAVKNPNCIAFTSGATESLNLIIQSMVSREDHVITSVLEHNSVLRPLYLSKCELSFLVCDLDGRVLVGQAEKLIKSNTKCIISTHGSNVTGAMTNVEQLYDICVKNGIKLILDVSQTMGSVEVKSDMADVLCFTGHKSLFGSQGTGGIVAGEELEFKLVKTGGAGSDSFAEHQALKMPDIFEAGTMNVPGIAGLNQGVSFINRVGQETISNKERNLVDRFLRGCDKTKNIRIYGEKSMSENQRLPIVSMNIGDIDPYEAARLLWENNNIAVRAGFMCAPLLHEFFGTAKRGMLRFSFGYYNTKDEIDIALEALKEMA